MPRHRSETRPTVERSIYFYRIDAGVDDTGYPIPFNPTPVLRHVDTLPFTDDGRYLNNADEYVTCCWIDPSTHNSRLRLGNVRKSGLPQVERAGTVSPLKIAPSSGLVEQVHVMFFPRNIVGSEFNFYGPRMSRLAAYFSFKADGACPSVTFEPLLRQDVTEQLQRFRDIRLLQLKIRASYSNTIAHANQDLGSAFEAAARAGDAEDLEIVLRPRAYSRGRLSESLLSTVKTLASRRDLHEEVSKFVVKGYDRETRDVKLVDILKDQLISRKKIILQDHRTRALDPGSAYQAIEEAYEELQVQLLTAAGVRQ